jgi:hypothetical protein
LDRGGRPGRPSGRPTRGFGCGRGRPPHAAPADGGYLSQADTQLRVSLAAILPPTGNFRSSRSGGIRTRH